MATLKISNLSVGDWVNVMTEKLTSLVFCEEIEITRGYIHSQIKGIREDGYIAVETADRRYTLVDIGCIGPIPITAEMLEKNGFERSTSQFIVYHTDKVWISYDKPSATWSVTMYINDFTSNLHANILHIHQLQHALRLAGIEKEINL